MYRSCIALSVLSVAVLANGCSRGSGVDRYQLTGTVSYEGEPVPFGWIVFSPENGPGATADIEDGKYSTPEGWGTVGGLHTIEVVGFDGIAFPDPNEEGGMNTAGKPIVRCEVSRDLPKETATWDIALTKADVPR